MQGHESSSVLIVGGGGAGLTASLLLSKLGVESLLVSALPTTSILPKAHVLNQRAMEILREAGVADAVYARSTPAGQMQATAGYAGLAGAHLECGRRIARMEAWGAGGRDPHWVAASACRSANLPQIRLEPILKDRAEQLAPAGRRRSWRDRPAQRRRPVPRARPTDGVAPSTSSSATTPRRGPAACWSVQSLTAVLLARGVRAYQTGMARSPRLDWLVETHVRPLYDFVRGTIETAQGEGLLPPGRPEHLHYMLIGAAASLYALGAESELLTGEDPADEALVAEHVAALERLFLPGSARV